MALHFDGISAYSHTSGQTYPDYVAASCWWRHTDTATVQDAALITCSSNLGGYEFIQVGVETRYGTPYDHRMVIKMYSGMAYGAPTIDETYGSWTSIDSDWHYLVVKYDLAGSSVATSCDVEDQSASTLAAYSSILNYFCFGVRLWQSGSTDYFEGDIGQALIAKASAAASPFDTKSIQWLSDGYWPRLTPMAQAATSPERFRYFPLDEAGGAYDLLAREQLTVSGTSWADNPAIRCPRPPSAS